MIEVEIERREELAVAEQMRAAHLLVEPPNELLQREALPLPRDQRLVQEIGDDAAQQAADLVPRLVLQAHERVRFPGDLHMAHEVVVAALDVPGSQQRRAKQAFAAGQRRVPRGLTVDELEHLVRERDVHLLRIEEAAQRVVARGQFRGALRDAILQLRVRTAQRLLLAEPLGLIDQETRHADGAPVLQDRLRITAGGKRGAVAPHKSVPLARGGPALAGDDASPVGDHARPVLLGHQIHEVDALRDHGRREPTLR